nr:immunoglobulin heavy chain junction region [Macaca mulatta]MOW89113.1 immunoglobulin heavy chain junction region [Macaca mulatta]MOW91880.1 immunoglobulin heavy chain junction region [Macaca mulatta]MOW92631.1 immunoglobulin heavy chain junction region [Macaca mulatta]
CARFEVEMVSPTPVYW